MVLSQLSGDNFAEAQQIAVKFGIEVCPATMFEVDPDEDEALAVSYQNLSTQKYVRDTYDMVVLCSDVGPSDGLSELARVADVELAQSGYVSVADASGSDVGTTQPGIFVAGCASGPKNITDSLATARAAAGSALANLDQRLLNAEYAPQVEALEDTDVLIAAEENRVLIEKMLYALLNQK